MLSHNLVTGSRGVFPRGLGGFDINLSCTSGYTSIITPRELGIIQLVTRCVIIQCGLRVGQ